MKELPQNINIQGIPRRASEKRILREFSKKRLSQERTLLAQEMWAERKEYTEKKKTLRDRINDLKKQLDTKSEKSSHIIADLEQIEKEERQKSRSLFSHLWNRLELRKLRETIDIQTKKNNALEAEELELGRLLQEAEEETSDQEELQEIRNKIVGFYQRVSNEWDEFVEDLETRSLSSVAQKYNRVFIHALHPTGIPTENSLLDQNVDWRTKLKVALTLRPTLAASTIEYGDDGDNMWARMGVVLSGGLIESAHWSDQGSRAVNFHRRSSRGSGYGIKKDIQMALQQRDRDGYNEFVVQSPVIAGFYYCEDKQDTRRIPDLISVEEIAAACEEFDLPLFKVENGELFRVSHDSRAKELVREKKIMPKDVVRIQYHLPEPKRQQLLEELRGKRVFKNTSM